MDMHIINVAGTMGHQKTKELEKCVNSTKRSKYSCMRET